MKQDIHPEWYAEATVTCQCGNTWQTGATVPEIRTEICSNCHPFYTGEQRIVDTEGRVDSFMKRLAKRDEIKEQQVAAKAALTPPDMTLEELGLSKRHINILQENDVKVVQDVLDLLNEGDEKLLSFSGIGVQALADIKKSLRTKGYDVPVTESE
jgi:large subunit ribosomal protein L31